MRNSIRVIEFFKYVEYAKFLGTGITKSDPVTPQGVANYLPAHLHIRNKHFTLWLHHVCLKGSSQVLVQSDSSRGWQRWELMVLAKDRKLENEATLLKHESDHDTIPLLPISLRGKARGLTMACKTLQDLLTAPPQLTDLSSCSPPSLIGSFLLLANTKHSPQGLCICWPCQEKSPGQLHRSLLSLFRSLLKCHHQRAFPDLVKEQPLAHAIIHPSHLTFFFSTYHLIHPFTHSCLFSH